MSVGKCINIVSELLSPKIALRTLGRQLLERLFFVVLCGDRGLFGRVDLEIVVVAESFWLVAPHLFLDFFFERGGRLQRRR